jgi:hypothetical protein
MAAGEERSYEKSLSNSAPIDTASIAGITLIVTTEILSD